MNIIYAFFACAACALRTLTTIFCSSIRKARMILKKKKRIMSQDHKNSNK